MKSIIKGILGLTTLVAATLSVSADFSSPDFVGPYAAGNWSVSGGTFTTPAPNIGVLTVDPGNTGITSISSVGTGPVSFVYSVQVGDTFSYAKWVDGSPSWTTLTGSTFGFISFDVTANQVFGFRVQDGNGAREGASIMNFSAPVPEPQTYAMFAGLALIGFASYRRFRTMSVKA